MRERGHIKCSDAQQSMAVDSHEGSASLVSPSRVGAGGLGKHRERALRGGQQEPGRCQDSVGFKAYWGSEARAQVMSR